MLFLYRVFDSPIHLLTPCSDDDYAVSVLAGLLNKSSDAAFFRKRAVTNPFTIYNNDTGFMEARNANGSWAGPDAGWTEGDKWAYSFDVVQDIDRLIQVRGGKNRFVKSLDEHFDGGGLHISLDARMEG
jgi:putative alpha-1,2-mannosidase